MSADAPHRSQRIPIVTRKACTGAACDDEYDDYDLFGLVKKNGVGIAAGARSNFRRDRSYRIPAPKSLSPLKNSCDDDSRSSYSIVTGAA
jgi:hypothetical protein